MKKTLSIILAILMIVTTIPIAFAADSDGVKTELDISKGKIVIADSYVTLNEENVEVDPDGYIITGESQYQDTALKIINNSGEEKTLNVVFKDLYISSMSWATAFCIDGNSPLTLNILLEGSTYIAAHSYAAIEGSIPEARVNFTTTEGSSLKLYDRFGGETSAFSYGFIVSIDGEEVGPDLHIHEYADGVQSCKGYLCSICDKYFGEKDESLHESDGVQDCRGYFCYICNSRYGERGPHKKDWQSCIGWFCNDCQKFNYPDEGDDKKHNWSYGTCYYCKAKFPEDAECLHDWDMESQCKKCAYKCEHQLVENNICSVCNSEMNFTLTTGDTVTYHKFFAPALNQAENGSKITLINDYYYGDNYEVFIQKDIIIDINGHKWCPETYLTMHILADVTITGSTGKGDFIPSLYIHSLCKLYDGYYSSVMLENSEIELDDLLPQCRVFTEVEAYDSALYENLAVTGKHSFTEYKEVKAPACVAEGLMVAECDNGCGETDEKEIEALNHKDTLVKVDAKAPTCTEIGWDAYEYCTACTYTTYVEKEALKHSFTKYEVTEEAKCGVAGKEVAVCDRGCGATDEKAVEALTHKDADGDYKCDNGCGHEFEKPAPEEPTDKACDHLCHKAGFMGFIWKIVKFFWKLFKMNPVCECGAAHY